MKRALFVGVFGALAAVLAGCPIYPDAHNTRVCDGNGCYLCPDDRLDDRCVDWQCGDSAECPSGYRCDSGGRCAPSTTTPPVGTGTTCSTAAECRSGEVCGADKRCHTGDCGQFGCPSNQVCKLANGALSCVASSPNDGGTTAPGCYKDADCSATAGAKCLSGKCTAPADQCSDATQCPGGQQCVQGVCTPSCSATKPCPTGFGCDLTKGVCTLNPTPCTEGGNTCTGGKTCVQERCVNPCNAGNTCPSGLVCVDGGCIPDQRPVFTCNVDGQRDACAQGSLCLRHSCYIACDSDASDACRASDRFNVCKSVTTSSGTYSVCGSDSNLGSECDPAQGRACNNPLVCIDGFCR